MRAQQTSGSSISVRIALALVLILSLAGSSCFEGEKGEPYYGRVVAPRVQEFRWSNGGLPRVFDPALAAAPPDTDVVRALFEGLTDYDPHRLVPVSAIATSWESSPDGRTWKFLLRRDARWSNGDTVTAKDFVRSWQRTLRLGDRAPHARLLANIEGAQNAVALVADPLTSIKTDPAIPPGRQPLQPTVKTEAGLPTSTPSSAPVFGATALADFVLLVRLQRPDRNFPALAAHPVFRPVHELRIEAESKIETTDQEHEALVEKNATPEEIVSNGAFRLSRRAEDSVVLERAQNYWDVKEVALERVKFIATRDAEAALNAYRKGEVDAVTNAAFEPLALKLLAPYKDFRRATYGALTYYSFNLTRAPFNDHRVREALTIAVDRERLSRDTMNGATEPAQTFLPAALVEKKSINDESTDGSTVETSGDSASPPLVYDVGRARRLLAEAGFAGGRGFPRIRLLVNRNEQQRLTALAVAAMWRSALGLETEVIVRNWDEYEAALWTGDYDIARRSMVMQTMDEESNLASMFESKAPSVAPLAVVSATPAGELVASAAGQEPTSDANAHPENTALTPKIATHEQALRELPALPVYFASSYALVKPYVTGFDANLLDAPSLKRVRLNTRWQPSPPEDTTRVINIR